MTNSRNVGGLMGDHAAVGAAMNVIALDPQQRARDLVANWRRQPTYVLVARCEALRAMQANGVRLPAEVYSAWIQMSAIVVVANLLR